MKSKMRHAESEVLIVRREKTCLTVLVRAQNMRVMSFGVTHGVHTSTCPPHQQYFATREGVATMLDSWRETSGCSGYSYVNASNR